MRSRGTELELEDAFGAHDIEYWVRRGNRLMPATEEDVARIHAWESQRIARALVARWARDERRPLRRWLARCRRWLLGDADRSRGARRPHVAAGPRVPEQV